jgi:hypothetical protein
MELLMLASISIAVIHSLAPDHYFPFVAIGKLKDWSVKKVAMFSGLAGVIHVTSSIVVGIILIYGINLLGFAELIEEISPIMLMLIGLTYAIVTVIRGHNHIHSPSAVMILLVIGLSPCIPLIPLMLAAKNSLELLIITAAFAMATVLTILILTYLSYKAFKPPEFLHGGEDVVAGLIIAAVGLITYIVEMVRTEKVRLKEVVG